MRKITVTLVLMLAVLTGCNGHKSKPFNKTAFDSLNASVLSAASNRGAIDTKRLSSGDQQLMKELGIKRIFVSSAETPKVVAYLTSATGIVTSGSAESVVYAEEALSPLVSDLAQSRAGGDKRILLYQKLAENWYLESLKN